MESLTQVFEAPQRMGMGTQSCRGQLDSYRGSTIRRFTYDREHSSFVWRESVEMSAETCDRNSYIASISLALEEDEVVALLMMYIMTRPVANSCSKIST